MKKLAKWITAPFIAAFGVVAMASMASASTALDGVSTQVTGAKDDLASFVTTTGVPVLFGLLILGVGIGLAVRYTRRGARSA